MALRAHKVIRDHKDQQELTETTVPRDHKETRDHKDHKEFKVRLDQQEPMALMVLTEMMVPRDHKEYKVRLDQQELMALMVQMV